MCAGFEGALERTVHKNATGLVPFASGFPRNPPCCAVVLTDTARAVYACAPGGHETLPATYEYPPLDLSHFVARYPHTPMPEMPPLPKLTPEQAAVVAANQERFLPTPAATLPAAQAAVAAQAVPVQAVPVSGGALAPALSRAENRAAWVQRVGREDVIAAGGDVFEVVPASGFDPAFKNPCWCGGCAVLRGPGVCALTRCCGLAGATRRACSACHTSTSSACPSAAPRTCTGG